MKQKIKPVRRVVFDTSTGFAISAYMIAKEANYENALETLAALGGRLPNVDDVPKIFLSTETDIKEIRSNFGNAFWLNHSSHTGGALYCSMSNGYYGYSFSSKTNRYAVWAIFEPQPGEHLDMTNPIIVPSSWVTAKQIEDNTDLYFPNSKQVTTFLSDNPEIADTGDEFWCSDSLDEKNGIVISLVKNKPSARTVALSEQKKAILFKWK